MQGITATAWKKKAIFRIGLLAFVVAAIIIGIYATYRVNADEASVRVSTPEESNMQVDVKVETGPVESDSTPDAVESANTPSSDTQQGETNTTNTNVDVRVDGTQIDVPDNGSVHKEINTEDGSTSVDISSQSSTSTGDSRTRSSVNIDVDSSVRVRSETRE